MKVLILSKKKIVEAINKMAGTDCEYFSFPINERDTYDFKDVAGYPHPGTAEALPHYLKDSDPVHHPSHYNSGKIEVIEAIEDWKLDFCLANTVKYVARAGKKDPTKIIEDLEKARWYLNRRIEFLKAEKEGREVKRPNDMVK